MTDLGLFHHFLGVHVTRDSHGLFLSQRQYILEHLDKAGITNFYPSCTPVDTSSKLSASGDHFSDATLYRSLTDALQYLTLTRPEIVSTCMILTFPTTTSSNTLFVIPKELLIMVSTYTLLLRQL
jgi:hypothetical protein